MNGAGRGGGGAGPGLLFFCVMSCHIVPCRAVSCRPAGMSSVRVECVVSSGFGIGESPVWDEKEGALLCVDIPGRRACRWSPGSGQLQAVPLGEALPGLCLRAAPKNLPCSPVSVPRFPVFPTLSKTVT